MKKTKGDIADVKRISVALETNGRGFIGFIAQLPGAYVRGKNEEEALSKVDGEVRSYARWLAVEAPVDYDICVSQRHHCSLMVEDADSEILLDGDRSAMNDHEFKELHELATYSGETIYRLYKNAELRDWVDESRVRKTFYGETPKTIQEIFGHVNGTQYYYLSRADLMSRERTSDFLQARHDCLSRLQEFFEQQDNDRIFHVDNEEWTLRKVLRRFVWHDRIHAKSIVRIMKKQKQLGLVVGFEDPFRFVT